MPLLNLIILWNLIQIIPLSFCTRSDLDNTNGLASSPNNLISQCGPTDTASESIYCSEGKYVYGFKVLDANGNGIINIVLDCRVPSYDSSINQWTTQDRETPQFALKGYFAEMNLRDNGWVYCSGDSGRDFVRGYALKILCPSDLNNRKGVVEIKMRCSFNDEIQSAQPKSTDNSAFWTAYSNCSDGYVACGYTMKKYCSSVCTYAILDISFECCRICDVSEGFYLTSSLECEFCHISCKECSGTATYCTKCHYGFELTASHFCVSIDPTGTILLENLFGESLDKFRTIPFAQNKVFEYKTCSNYLIYGGYPDLTGNSGMFEKHINFNQIPSHSYLVILVHFFKIGDWSDKRGSLMLFNSKYYFPWSNPQSPIYYSSSDCGDGYKLQNTKKIEIVFPHGYSFLILTFQQYDILDTGYIAYWGISRLQIIAFGCHSTCLTCTGLAANECTSCSSGFFLSSSTCVAECDSSQYGDPTTNKCVTSCPDNYFINRYDRKCYKICPNSTYGNRITRYCVDFCPDKMYGNDINFLCLYCDFNCETCSKNAENCLNCKFSWLEQAPKCQNPTCISFN